MEIQVPLMNIVNGGKHSGSGLAIQEFMIIPAGAKDLSDSVRMGSEVYHQLGSILSKSLGKSSINVGDEGGFAPATTKSTKLSINYTSTNLVLIMMRWKMFCVPKLRYLT
jgi:enolase